MSWGSPGNRLGGCVLQGSIALARAALWPGPRPWGGYSFHIPASSTSQHRHSMQSSGPDLHYVAAWGVRGPVGLGAFLPQADTWAVSGDLALSKPPAELCLFSVRTGTWEGDSCAWDLALSCPNRELHLVTWPWSDLNNKGSDSKGFITINKAPPSPFLEKGFDENFWGVWAFSGTSTQLLMFWNGLASLCMGHTDRCLGKTGLCVC